MVVIILYFQLISCRSPFHRTEDEVINRYKITLSKASSTSAYGNIEDKKKARSTAQGVDNKLLGSILIKKSTIKGNCVHSFRK